MPSVHCPKCGGADIRESNTAYAELPVTHWLFEEGEAPEPQSYDTDVSIDWQTADGPNNYVCNECRWEGSTDELTVKED